MQPIVSTIFVPAFEKDQKKVSARKIHLLLILILYLSVVGIAVEVETAKDTSLKNNITGGGN